VGTCVYILSKRVACLQEKVACCGCFTLAWTALLYVSAGSKGDELLVRVFYRIQFFHAPLPIPEKQTLPQLSEIA
jgi:hypothetical protein